MTKADLIAVLQADPSPGATPVVVRVDAPLADVVRVARRVWAVWRRPLTDGHFEDGATARSGRVLTLNLD